MPRNIEIKARLPDRPAVEARAAALASSGPVVLHQDDTFFGGASGRLKLRTLSPGSGELIAYRRADEAGPKTSNYLISTTTEPDRLREVLARAYDVSGRVVKTRTLYLAGRTRIHLDRVEGLGDWLELEVVLQDTDDERLGIAEAHELMAALGVSPAQCVEGAYVDLLAAAPAPPAPSDDESTTDLSPWRVTASRHLVRGRWLTLRADTCVVPDGPTLDPYYVLEERDWTHVMAFEPDGRVLLVHQYRHGAGVATAEWPGGVVDDGETPAEAARRELREETGRDAVEWHAAGAAWANPARQTNRVHIFLARGLREATGHRPDDAERLVVERVTVDDLRARIADGRFAHGLHVGLFHLGLEAARTLGWLDAAPARER
jgi:predicted adenylyl cyclase CyaB